MGSCGDEEATVQGQRQEATVQPGECAGGWGGIGDLLPQTHLADAVDTEVTAGLALVAGCAVQHGVPQLLGKVPIRGPAVQLTGVLWGPKRRTREGQRRRSQGGHWEDCAGGSAGLGASARCRRAVGQGTAPGTARSGPGLRHG